jgi:hypothetical protein
MHVAFLVTKHWATRSHLEWKLLTVKPNKIGKILVAHFSDCQVNCRKLQMNCWNNFPELIFILYPPSTLGNSSSTSLAVVLFFHHIQLILEFRLRPSSWNLFCCVGIWQNFMQRKLLSHFECKFIVRGTFSMQCFNSKTGFFVGNENCNAKLRRLLSFYRHKQSTQFCQFVSKITWQVQLIFFWISWGDDMYFYSDVKHMLDLMKKF